MSFFKGVSGPPPAAAPVAVQSTQGRSFHTIQVLKEGFISYIFNEYFYKCKKVNFQAPNSNVHFVLRRTSKAGFRSLVDFILLRKTEPARHAERI